MNQTAQESAIKRDERAIFLPAKGDMQQAFTELKDSIIYAIQTGDYSHIENVCNENIASLLNELTVLAYLKGGRRAELAAENVVEESASEYAPLQFSLRSDGDARVRGTIDYLRRVSGLDPSNAQSAFEKHNAGEIKGLSSAIILEVKKAVKDLIERGIHVEGGKAKIAQILLANNIKVLNVTALAETLFRTQSMQAYAAGRWNSAFDKGYGKYIWGFQYVTVRDNRVREGHRVLEGVRLPKDDPFWLKYFPPNGWNCRCTTLEIWTGDPRARIDFGITGRDPRKRTAEEMNVPPAFQGNVGIFAQTGNQEQTNNTQSSVEEKQKPVIEVPPPNNIIIEKTKNGTLTFKNAVHKFWYDVSVYIPKMKVVPRPKLKLEIVLNNTGLNVYLLNRKKGFINVWRYGGSDHYNGAYAWKSINLEDCQNAGESLRLLRQHAASVEGVNPTQIKLILSSTSYKKIEGLGINTDIIKKKEPKKGKSENEVKSRRKADNPQDNENVIVTKPKTDKKNKKNSRHFAKKVTREEHITYNEVGVARNALPASSSNNWDFLWISQNGLGIDLSYNNKVFARIKKFSEETTDFTK